MVSQSVLPVEYGNSEIYGLAPSSSKKQISAPPVQFSLPQGGRLSVCHVCEGGGWAGAEVQATTLLRALSKRPEISLYAIVLREGRLARELRRIGVPLTIGNEEHTSFPKLIAECASSLKGKDIQILHSHSYKENIVAWLLSCFCNVPYLVRTEHGRPEPYSVVRNPKHWCVLAVDRMAAKYTEAQIVGVSSDMAAFWQAHTDRKRVSIIRNGVDLRSVSSSYSQTEAKHRLGISSQTMVIGSVARLEYIKRLDLFVAAARHVATEIPHSYFVIAGDGRRKPALEQLIIEYGLKNRVALLGECHDVYDVLRAMDILLICSDHEGIPMAMLEAMALGVVVVSRNVGGIPEVIQNGINGVLVTSDNPEELGRTCVSVLRNSCLMANLRTCAINDVQREYSADKNAERMLEMYRSLYGRFIA